MSLFRSHDSEPWVDPSQKCYAVRVHFHVAIGNIRESLPFRNQIEQLIEKQWSEVMYYFLLKQMSLLVTQRLRIDNLMTLKLMLF